MPNDHPARRPIFGSANLIFRKHRIDLMIEQSTETQEYGSLILAYVWLFKDFSNLMEGFVFKIVRIIRIGLLPMRSRGSYCLIISIYLKFSMKLYKIKID